MTRILRAALLALTCAAALPAQADLRTWVFPALVYGDDRWSVIRLTNTGTAIQPVSIDAYDAKGTPRPIAGAINVPPGQTTEVRLDFPNKEGALGWASVSATVPKAETLQVQAVTEFLVGNKIQWVARESAPVLKRNGGAFEVHDPVHLYFLNLGDRAVDLEYCLADLLRNDACRKGLEKPIRARVEPRHALFTDALGKPANVGRRAGQTRYLVTTLNRSTPSILIFLSNTSGMAKTFSTETKLSFDEEPGTEPAK
jgi:hypothetical protein